MQWSGAKEDSPMALGAADTVFQSYNIYIVL